MKIGTKSLLFGCHQFLWHPFTVFLAYRKLFRVWPDFYACLCIFFHDWGYWGCADIDGKEGKLHPMLGAQIVGKIVYWHNWLKGKRDFESCLIACGEAHRCLLHSSSVARDNGMAPSDICWADKYCVFYESDWFYLFRTWLSGEGDEFRLNAVNSGHVPKDATNRDWQKWYKSHLLKRPEIHDLLRDESPVRQHLLRNTPRVLKEWKKSIEKNRSKPVACTNTHGPARVD